MTDTELLNAIINLKLDVMRDGFDKTWWVSHATETVVYQNPDLRMAIQNAVEKRDGRGL